MRQYPTDEDDQLEAVTLNAEPWMLDLLKRNPSYVYWGPHEDSMCDSEGGWRAPIFIKTWPEMYALDELNECVNFYFSVVRKQEECPACEGSGYNPETHTIAENFYNHSSATGVGWNDQITEDEVDALWAAKRLWHFKERPTVAEVNQHQRGRGFGHDAINRHILIQVRATRLGVYGKCPECVGNGYVFTEPKAVARLTLWMLVPRKGASRAVEVESLSEADLPSVFAWLRTAAERNAQRFQGVM